jgi:hypothetical protein
LLILLGEHSPKHLFFDEFACSGVSYMNCPCCLQFSDIFSSLMRQKYIPSNTTFFCICFFQQQNMDRGSLITLSIVAGVAAIAAGVVLWKRMKKTSSTVDPEVGQSSAVSPALVKPAAKPKSTTQSTPVAETVCKKPTFTWEKV